MSRMTQLHVIRRSTGKVNGKPRPAGMDKVVCLLSLLRAIERVEQDGDVVELVHLCDGRVGGAHGEVIASRGEVVERPLTLEMSYATAAALPLERGWPAEDLVYLVEDDHLHRPDALRLVLAAARASTGTGYFAFYADTDGLDPSTGVPPAPPVHAPTQWRQSTSSLVVEGWEWRRALAMTSSFLARVSALREDRLIHRFAFRTRGNPARDHVVAVSVQGHRPFTWGRPLQHVLHPDGQGSLEVRVKQSVWDVVLNVLGIVNRTRHRDILSTRPSLSTHAQAGWLAFGTDWEQVAADTRAWAAERGLPTEDDPAVCQAP